MLTNYLFEIVVDYLVISNNVLNTILYVRIINRSVAACYNHRRNAFAYLFFDYIDSRYLCVLKIN